MNKILLIITSFANSYEVNRIKEEALNLGLRPYILLPYSINLHIKNNNINLDISPKAREYFLKEMDYDPKELQIWMENYIPKDIQAVIFRAVNRRPFKKISSLRPFMVYYFDKQNIPVFNREKLLLGFIDKVYQMQIFFENNIPFVPTYMVNSKYGFNDFFKNNPGEYFIKPYNSSHGNGTLIAKKSSDIPEDRRDEEYLLIQQRLRSKWDLRVLIVNGKAIGGMERHATNDSIITNVSAGGSAKLHQLTQKEKDLAEKVASLFKSSYGGVDIMYDQNNNPYVLEFNSNAQFKGFEQATGINIAQKIIKSLL